MRIVADETGTIVSVSGEGLGFTADDLVGRNISSLVPEALMDGHLQGFGRWSADGSKKIMGRWMSWPALGSDGSERTVRMVLTEHTSGGARRVEAVIDA